MIVRFLLQILLRGLPTRNDRLQDNQLVVFDEGHEVDIVVTLDDEDPLAAVSLLVRVFQDVEHVPLSEEEHDLFEPDAAVGPQLLVLRVIPGEIFHRSESIKNVCLLGTHLAQRIVPLLCPLMLEFGVFRYEMLIREKGELMQHDQLFADMLSLLLYK